MGTKPRCEKSTFDYAFGALFQLAVLVMINSWPKWQPHTFGVVTPAYEQVVWAANLTALAELARNALLAITRPQWLIHLSKMIAAVASVISTSAFLAIFPFEFSIFGGPWMNALVRCGLLIALVVTTFSVLVNAVRFIFSGPRPTPGVTTRA